MTPFTDEEIIGAIRAGGRALENALRQLYADVRYKRLAEIAARRFNGNAEDVEDLFQEGLWLLFQKVEHGAFEERSALSTFFGSIVNNISLNRYTTQQRRSVNLAGLPPIAEEASTETDTLFWKEKIALLDKAIAVLEEKCKPVLEYWAAGYSMKEMAEMLGIKDEMAAKNKKKNCLNALRAWMKDHPKDAIRIKEGL